MTTIRDGPVGLHFPRILCIKLIPVQTILAPYWDSQLPSRGVQHIAVLVVVVIGNHVGNHAEQTHNRIVELRSGRGFGVRQTSSRVCSVTWIQRTAARGTPDGPARQRVIHGIRMDRGVGKTSRRHPVGCALADTERVLVTQARIAGKPNVGSELECLLTLGPGKIVHEIVYRRLCVMAVDDPLVESVEDVPLGVGVADNSRALPREAPVKTVYDVRTQHGRVADGKSFAVIIEDRFWAASR